MTTTTIPLKKQRRLVRLGQAFPGYCIVRWWVLAKRTSDGKIKSKRDQCEEQCGDRKIRRVVRRGKR